MARATSKAATDKPAKKPGKAKRVEAFGHGKSAKRVNIPTAEYQSAAERQEELDPRAPLRMQQRRTRPLASGTTRPRNTDLDPQMIWNGVRLTLTPKQVRMLIEREKEGKPATIDLADAQLVWRGKDEQDWSDLIVNAPPLYIQDKIHPQAIIDDLLRQSQQRQQADEAQPSLFADHFHDFNGLSDLEKRTEFYQHDQYWQNRMILGDSLAVMASLAEREALRGKVQCIYFDPPYGIKFNSNWQVSTQSRDVKDGKTTDISREPEQVKAFRDTWKDGIHSYLTYLRDRLTVARELLHDSGSIFVQIGDENVHRVRAVMDEVFGAKNVVSEIIYQKTGDQPSDFIPNVSDVVLWYARDIDHMKYRSLYRSKMTSGTADRDYSRVTEDGRRYQLTSLTSNRPPGYFEVSHNGKEFTPGKGYWKTGQPGFVRLSKADRLRNSGESIRYLRYFDDFSVQRLTNVWTDTITAGFSSNKVYIVETLEAVVQRCLLMATDPGDLVLDPTCGSGTTATVAEQWGRRWITIDTSRVALALARTRLMSARYPFYYLADTKDGREQEQKVSGKIQPDTPTDGDIRHGFIYERAPHITLKSIANNAEIDVIWDKWQQTLEPMRDDMNKALKMTQEEWQIPRNAEADWSDAAKKTLAAWREARIARQKEIDASIAKAADVEYLYDRPYEDKFRVRVAGPFTVESLSPHRVIPSGEEELAHDLKALSGKKRRAKLATPPTDFSTMVLDHLRMAGVQQGAKGDRIVLDPITGWPGEYIGAEGIFLEGSTQRRAAILIGPEFGTLSRVDLVAAAREATEARFDVLIACAFAYDAHATELNKLAALPILKAKMNPDLHMAADLKNTGKGNLFIIFGEPDVEIVEQGDDRIAVKINGVDVFDQNTGDIRSGDTKSIAAWFIDTDYNEESFFVRHAYFLGANDPYKSLKTALRAEIDEEAWSTLYRDTSRPFARPKTGRIAVKVINHFGDEVMKVWQV
jgi:adenine-specific DNA-methyltransferase